MKIEVVKYNPEWPKKFNEIKDELQTILCELNLAIEHIGSTAVPNLAAKPIIDIAIGVTNLPDLDKTIEPMLKNHYLYYEAYNYVMPQRRFFVGLKNRKDSKKFNSVYIRGDLIPHKAIHCYKLCHIHVWKFNSQEWIRHIAFRDYLIKHPEISIQYEKLKKKLSTKNWLNGNEYNDGKNSFFKREQTKAIFWYNKKHKQQFKTNVAKP